MKVATVSFSLVGKILLGDSLRKTPPLKPHKVGKRLLIRKGIRQGNTTPLLAFAVIGFIFNLNWDEMGA